MTNIAVCQLSELRTGEAISQEVAIGERVISLIIYAGEGDPSVFLNSCPHTGVRLDWRPNDFMDPANCYLQCAMHGALFETYNGLCIVGPCEGRSLVKVDSEIIGTSVFARDLHELPGSAKRA